MADKNSIFMLEHANPPKIIAAFDFDGTITTSDSLRDFILHTIGLPRFIFGVICTLPWLAGFLSGICKRSTAKIHFLNATIGNMNQQELEYAAQQYASQRLPALIRPEMLDKIQEHRDHGHQLILVSASPTLYLKYWARNNGFDAVLATELAYHQNKFAGHFASPNCWGPEKVNRLRQWFGNHPPLTMYAYGDSRGDAEMLALADYGWLRGSQHKMPKIQ